MLDANSGVDGVFLVNKGLYVNEDANIIDGLAIGSGFADSTAPANSLVVEGQLGIGTDSPGILVPGSKVNLHNFLTGIGDLNLVNLNEISSIVFTGIKNLWINTNLLDSVTGTPTVELNRTLISNSQLSSLYLNKIELDTITATNFYGSQIEFSGPTTISGNFYGSKIDIPTGAVDFTGSSKEIFGSQFILGENDFTGSSADVYGSKMLLSPNLAASSGSTFRGSHIELLDYIPASNTEIRGSQITIDPKSTTFPVLGRPMGDIFGQNININSNMLVANSSEIYGVNININTGGLSLPLTSYGIKVAIGDSVLVGGTRYGIYVSGMSNDTQLENYLQGKLTIDGADNHDSNFTPGYATPDENMFASGVVTIASWCYYQWTRIGNIVTLNGTITSTSAPFNQARFPAPLQKASGSINPQGTAVAKDSPASGYTTGYPKDAGSWYIDLIRTGKTTSSIGGDWDLGAGERIAFSISYELT
jgi:hypothetical protein